VNVRRLVTGLDPAGRSVVVSDAEVAPVRTRLMPGAEWHLLWADDAPALGTAPPEGTPAYFPPPGGVRFGTFTLPPAATATTGVPDRAAAEAEMDAALPGLRSTIEGDPSGRHATASVDFELVLSGAVTLELPDGSTTRLHPGDTVVQNGAVHRWVNDGDVPAVIALVMLGVPG
jgi:hypothetical protein